jgi:hypothetical protein
MQALRVEVARYLADYSSSRPADLNFVTWSEEDIDHYIVTAAQQAFAARPAAFAQQETVTGPQDVVDFGAGSKVLAALAVTDANGVAVSTHWVKRRREPIPTTSATFCEGGRLGAAPVRSTRVVTQFPDAPHILKVDTPLAAGETLKVLVARAPDATTMGAIPAHLRPAIFHWAVAIAMGTEVESAAFRAESRKHWGWGADVMALNRLERQQAMPETAVA